MNRMKRKFAIIYLLLFLLVLNNASGGNNSDSLIVIKPHWKKGEIKKYELVQKIQVSVNSSPMQVTSNSSQTISEISLTVRDITANYIELEWRYDTIKVFDSLIQNSGEPKKSPQPLLLKGKTIKYRTDLDGKIIEIINFPELSAQLKPSIDSVTPPFMKSFMPNYVASFILKDLLIFHKLYGHQLKIGDTTIIKNKDSFSPNINLPSVSYKVILQGTELATGVCLIKGEPLGIDETKIFSNFTYEFSTNSFWVGRYKSMMNTAIPDSFITNEYESILLP